MFQMECMKIPYEGSKIHVKMDQNKGEIEFWMVHLRS